MKVGLQPRRWLEKAARGVRGYPVGMIAFYGPDDRRATEAAVGIVPAPDTDVADLRRRFGETGDLKSYGTVLAEIAEFLREQEGHPVAMTDGIIGCPHEDGVDSPDDGVCPDRPYWVGRNHWTGAFHPD